MGSKGRKKPSLQSLSRLPMNMETFFKELGGESDRACALIAGAAISDGLRDLLKLYFVKLEEVDIDHLLYDQNASLGDFASRTDVSFALGLISPKERLVANVIRRIRNQFAHTLAQIDFSHELIIAELSKISPGKPSSNEVVKGGFIRISLALYLALRARGDYLAKQRSGLTGGWPVPIYELAKQKRPDGMVAPR
jgi:DNA-binding MltR family transcriptional regulator